MGIIKCRIKKKKKKTLQSKDTSQLLKKSKYIHQI